MIDSRKRNFFKMFLRPKPVLEFSHGLDPKRRFTTVNCRIAKGSFGLDVGCLGQGVIRRTLPHRHLLAAPSFPSIRAAPRSSMMVSGFSGGFFLPSSGDLSWPAWFGAYRHSSFLIVMEDMLPSRMIGDGIGKTNTSSAMGVGQGWGMRCVRRRRIGPFQIRDVKFNALLPLEIGRLPAHIAKDGTLSAGRSIGFAEWCSMDLSWMSE
jgi:hypothetical protein